MIRGAKRQRRPLQAWDDLSDFKDINLNASCFIVGAGPSVGFVNLSAIHNHVVISVNASALLMPWFEEGDEDRRFWLSNDALCMRWSYFQSHVMKFKCTKLVGAEWRQHDVKLRGHGFRFFSPRNSQSHPLSDSDPGLCSVSSVPSAIDFALLMGCKRIYLLGVDQKMTQGHSHFWQFWDKSKWPQRSDQQKNFQPEQKHQVVVFKKNQSTFKSLKEYSITKEAVVKNCSSRSSLEVFEKISLDDALKEVSDSSQT